MKKQWRRLTGMLLAASFLISSLGVTALAADPQMEKSETVYVITDASGKADEVIVSDWLKNLGGADVLKDSSDLQNIEVVQGDAERSGSGSGLSWTTGGEDVYYQGTSTKALPVGVKFTYKLNGQTVAPEELAGRSGKLTIEIRYTNTQKQTVKINGKNETMYVPFLMATGLIMDSSKAANVEVDHGMVQNDGDRTIVLGYGMPGLSDSLKLDGMADSLKSMQDEDDQKEVEVPEIPDTVTITADVTDFELSMVITVATSDILKDVDLDNPDTREALEDALDELEDAAQQLTDGTKELLEGVEELQVDTRPVLGLREDFGDGSKSSCPMVDEAR